VLAAADSAQHFSQVLPCRIPIGGINQMDLPKQLQRPWGVLSNSACHEVKAVNFLYPPKKGGL